VSKLAKLIPFELTVCGIEELAGHCEVGVSHVLSILDPGYPEPPAFGSYGEHRRLELRFHDIIDEMPGMLPPRAEDVAMVLAFGRDLMGEPRSQGHLLVHCHAGISRSTASMMLILAQARPDVPARDIVSHVVDIRARAWPNLRILELGDKLLGRKGDLVAAARERYRVVVQQRPEWKQFMLDAGRSREVLGDL
jgi:predicted protein tyrosine phosphatase